MSFADRPAVCQAPECGATIVFRHNAKSGKWQPFDIEPVTCKACEGTGLGAVVEGEPELCEKCNGRGTVSMTHFATCPSAKGFRKAQR